MISPGSTIGAVPLGVWRRLWIKVAFPPRDRLYRACWTWTGAFSLKRRGRRPVLQLGARGSRVVLVARLVCERWNGPPPSPAHEAGHTCPDGENAACVSPWHLAWMSREENERYKQYRRQGLAVEGPVPQQGTAPSVEEEPDQYRAG